MCEMSKKGIGAIGLVLAILFLLAELWPVQVQAAAEWVKRYSSPGNSSDEPGAIAVDSLGNVYVSGRARGTYSHDYLTIKYNSAGAVQWRRRYNGPQGSADYAYAMAVDGSSNVYVTGESAGVSSLQDYATIKYNSAGTRQWVRRYNGPGNGNDKATAVAVDGSGNVYITGESRGSGGNQDYATIKYNSAGVQQWVKRYNGAGNGLDVAKAIGRDGAGNVYVTGVCQWSANNDFITIKYNSGGVRQWVRRYNGPGNGWDTALAMAVDNCGTVYASGISYGAGAGGTFDYATVKYNSAGAMQWVRRYAGPAGGYDCVYAIVLDVTGNVYITGQSERSPGSNYDYATIKYSSAGVRQWVERYNGPANDNDTGYRIAVDGAGNAYVAGCSTGTTTGRDWVTIKY